MPGQQTVRLVETKTPGAEAERAGKGEGGGTKRLLNHGLR